MFRELDAQKSPPWFLTFLSTTSRIAMIMKSNYTKCMGWIPVEVLCFVYGIFCCVLAAFGILSLLMARTFIDPGPHYEGLSIGLPHNFYEDDKADEIKDFPLDFSWNSLYSEDLPLSGYGLVLYICFFGSFLFSVLLCYGIHKRNPNHLRTYLLYGFVLTALMLLCFFYLFVWFTDMSFFTFIPMYMTLSMHLAARCIIKRAQELFYTEQYKGITQLNGFYTKGS